MLESRASADSRLDCASLHDLLPGLALGMLDERERVAAEAHLAVCGRAVAALAALAATVAALPPRVPAPDRLWSRIAAAL
jgi:hypothetical protein